MLDKNMQEALAKKQRNLSMRIRVWHRYVAGLIKGIGLPKLTTNVI